MRDLPKIKFDLQKPESFGNLAERLDQSERRVLAEDMIQLIELDRQSMNEWLGEVEGYIDTVKAGRSKTSSGTNREAQGANEGEVPSTEMTLTAVIQFAARATSALLGEPDLAKASDTGSEKLAEWVSRQVRVEDPDWLLNTDPLVAHMSVTGLAWRKRAFDKFDKKFHSYFCTCSEIIFNADAPSIARLPRIAHDFTRYPYEIDRSIRRNHWVDYEPVYDDEDPQAKKHFFECDAWLDLDGDGDDEPWTITISRDDFAEVVAIEPRWTRKTIVVDKDTLFFKPVQRLYPYIFLPDFDGGVLPQGFGKLLARAESTADTLLASILDTAQNEAKNGGVLAGGGTGLPAAEVELDTNRVTTVETDGRPLTDMFQAFPQKSVSAGSVSVLDKVITLGDRIAGTLNLLENAPASMTATLAKGLIDNGTQVQSAVHRRMVSSMTQEFHWFVRMADAYDMLPQEVQGADIGSVAVTADPQMATEMHRAAAGAMYLEMLQIPVFIPQQVAMRYCQVMRIPNPEQLVAPAQPPQATPKEKIDGFVNMEKAKTERMKAMGGIIVSITQGLKNISDAGNGLVNMQAATLQMAQLENAVQMLISEAQGGNAQLDGMAQQPGDGGAPQLPPGPPASDGQDLSGGLAGDAAGAGAGQGT